MGRLIDSDILIAELKESALHHCNNSREDSLLQRDRVIVRAQPTVEAIPQADYETRLKADMVAMLEKLKSEIILQVIDEPTENGTIAEMASFNSGIVGSYDLIQQKINALQGEEE